ncbi:MAG TPA: 50S ribosomal protein L23 [Candidatus Saccharimonadales bacterium]
MISLAPRLSEKTYKLAQTDNTYVFDVPASANKQQVKAAVESRFKVAVVKINTQLKSGKTKRSVRKRSQPVIGTEKAVKRAYVRLKSGDKIPMFEEGA